MRVRGAGLWIILSLCGCGGDGSSDPPIRQNRPPAFTSATSASVPEGGTGTIYSASATDPDNDPLSFSISGGVDAGQFQITPAGALSFRTAPDFEAPVDADRNNVYQVQLAVSDGAASVMLALSVTVTDATTGAFRVRRVALGFSQPLYAVGVPGGRDRLFIVERTGQIRIMTPSTGAIAGAPFLDVGGQISTDGERGLLGLALAPNFQQSGTAYVYLTNPAGTIEIRRYRTITGNSDRLDPTSADIILSIPHPTFSNHNGGWIDFGPDGFLYVATGDGGGANDPGANSQNRASLLGKMLRIDVNRDDFPSDDARDYAIPAGNPFASEIWAYGLRNPFRNSFDRVTGNLWIGDVGQGAIEEIDLMRASDAGANFGWPLFEGTMALAGQPGTGLTFPVTEYSHGTGARQGNSVTGGYVYRGPVEALQGLYIFGDFIRGAMWSVPISQLTPGTTRPSSSFTVRTQDFAPQTGSINNIASFGQDQNGNLYIVDFDGEIFVIEPVP
ncbi:PQQ-dependent sugar dehydrogenase [Sphingomonas cavernae]|nr:PQQ-dependent sugar dehydrogenase [Sphingomonas cavernae]